MNPLDFLSGWKSYILGVATILGGIVLLIEGKYVEAVAAITAGLGLLTNRRAVDRAAA